MCRFLKFKNSLIKMLRFIRGLGDTVDKMTKILSKINWLASKIVKLIKNSIV